jgi:hypothetical protein
MVKLLGLDQTVHCVLALKILLGLDLLSMPTTSTHGQSAQTEECAIARLELAHVSLDMMELLASARNAPTTAVAVVFAGQNLT